MDGVSVLMRNEWMDCEGANNSSRLIIFTNHHLVHLIIYKSKFLL